MIVAIAERTSGQRQRTGALPGLIAGSVGVADVAVRHVAPTGAGPVKVVAVAADEQRQRKIISRIVAGVALKPVAEKLVGDRAAVGRESNRHGGRVPVNGEAGGGNAGLRDGLVACVIQREGTNV